MRRSLVGVLLLAACVQPAAAQTPATQTPAASPSGGGVAFLPRAALRLTAEHISSRDARFVWDANFGGDVDLVDYGRGRVAFEANYQTVLGEELHAFDPNQGNYILALSASRRLPHLEAALVFHHESRHLSDRPKQVPVDWNMVGGRVQVELAGSERQLTTRADVRKVVQRSFVDYQWEVDAEVRGQQRMVAGLRLIGGAGVRRLWVDGSGHRGNQLGARGEGGVRFEGRGGAAELFIAMERRIDPTALEFATATWLMAGFRLLSR